MGYRKQIKGNDNVASEEFSHNRVSIDFSGTGITMFAGFLILLITAAILWMVIREGSLFSLLIIASFISIFLGALIVGGCYIVRQVSMTRRQVLSDTLTRNLIVAGEIVAYRDGAQWDHLSASHEMAKLPPPTTVTVQEDPTSTDEAIVDLWRKGLSLRDITKITNRKYHEVQKITSDQKGDYRNQ